MRVPRLLVLTDRGQAASGGHVLIDVVATALDAGAPAILLREKDLPPGERRDLAGRVADVVADRGADLFVASDPALAEDVGAAGLHLAADDRPVALPGRLTGRSCHDAGEVRAAVAENRDYVTVSPVAPTASKPGHGPPLGPVGLGELVADAAGLPVLALGGVTPDLVPDLRAAGAHGVAVMGAVMRAGDPGAVVRRLLDRFTEDPS